MEHFNMSAINTINNDTGFLVVGLYFNLAVVLPENSYVIWLIITGAGNGVASEFFSLNLSICELFFCLQSLLMLTSSTVPALMYIASFLTGIPVAGRPLFQCLICVERYLAVVHPVIFLKTKPLRYRLICSNLAWLLIFIACLFTTFGLIEMYLYMCYCLCQALLTLSVNLFCCLAVLRALKQSRPGQRAKDKAKENLMKKKAFNTIVLIMMAIVFMYSAYLVAGFVYVLMNQFVPRLWSAGQVCFVLGGLVQPYLFLYRTGKVPFCKSC